MHPPNSCLGPVRQILLQRLLSKDLGGNSAKGSRQILGKCEAICRTPRSDPLIAPCAPQSYAHPHLVKHAETLSG